MKKIPTMILGLVPVLTWILQVSPLSADPVPLPGIPGTFKSAPNWRPVERILGRQGTEQEDMLKVTFPRTDLNVTVKGVPLEPALALTSWFAFKPLNAARGEPNHGTMMTGEMVLLDQEVSKVLGQLVKNDLEVTAIHNPLLYESPNVKYVHISGHGSRANLARAVKDLLSFTGTPLGQDFPPRFSGSKGQAGEQATPKQQLQATPGATPALSTGSASPGKGWSEVQELLGPGKVNGRVLQYEFPRAEPVTEKGMEIPPFMGVATSLNFQKVEGLAIGPKGTFGLATGSPPSRDLVAGAGYFALTAGEVNAVVKALAKSHIVVTAIQSRLLEESPRLFFLYFWALGRPGETASGLKTALGLVHPATTK